MGAQTITSTDFKFPAQTSLYHGKVRDVYAIEDKYLVMIASDRISAFDIILPRTIPFKGQVLNQVAAHFLQATKDIVPNWLLSVPDPNASLGIKVQPFKLEMVVRGCLVGHVWRVYQSGLRELCGAALPAGLNEYDLLPRPILTPSTKADAGHDQDLTPSEIIAQGLASQTEFDQLSTYALQLFARGQAMAADRGLFLADTKYEFGKQGDQLYLIDEIHTPDSSRYFYKDSFDAFVNGQSTELPRHLSKEFVRDWLMRRGFMGQTSQTIPEMTDDFVNSVSRRYIELFEQLTGQPFDKVSAEHPQQRIESNVKAALRELV